MKIGCRLGVGKAYRTVGKVYVVPAQAQHFAEPHACQGEQPYGVQGTGKLAAALLGPCQRFAYAPQFAIGKETLSLLFRETFDANAGVVGPQLPILAGEAHNLGQAGQRPVGLVRRFPQRVVPSFDFGAA